MNEDEKKAIEIVKEIKDIRGMRKDVEGENEDLWALDTLINLINKQQKEIEKYRKLRADIIKVNKKIYDVDIIEDMCEQLANSISKDKIRKFIEEYLPDDEIMETCSMYDVNGIYVREELEKILGE